MIERRLRDQVRLEWSETGARAEFITPAPIATLDAFRQTRHASSRQAGDDGSSVRTLASNDKVPRDAYRSRKTDAFDARQADAGRSVTSNAALIQQIGVKKSNPR
jgi:hypothetical protein